MRWRASGEVFRGLATASVDRVAGREIGPWLPHGETGAPLRRLQQEMQMLLYTHPVTDQRQLLGLPAVNSFWIHGTGELPAGPLPRPPAGVQMIPALSEPAGQDDAASWQAKWQEVDASTLANLLKDLEAGRSLKLTLCGERNARTWSSGGAGLWRRLTNAFNRPTVAAVLETL
jgi:hypothetical protein